MVSNKVAIITGANKGLGFAIVKILCQKYDGKVYLTSRDERRALAACENLRSMNCKPAYHQLDITNNESIKKFLKHIQDNKEEVELLFNNAAILFLNSPESKIFQTEQTIFVNFTSLVNFTEAILPFMKYPSRIINISSSSGHLSRIPSELLRKQLSSEELTLDALVDLINSYVEDVKEDKNLDNSWGNSPYVVSKVAVNAYTFILHRLLSPKGIVVNCVHPGYVMSDMTNGAGSISPENAATIPVTLALEPTTGGRYVWHNGQDVPWDGEDPRKYIDGKIV